MVLTTSVISLLRHFILFIYFLYSVVFYCSAHVMKGICVICTASTGLIYLEKEICEACRAFYLRIRKNPIAACMLNKRCRGTAAIRSCGDCRMKKCRAEFDVDDDDDDLCGKTIDQWKIQQLLGEGGFGKVYLVKEGERRFAMKCERSAEDSDSLKMEIGVLQKLSQEPAERRKHFIELVGQGRTDSVKYMVVSLVGKSLNSLRLDNIRKIFTMPCLLGVALQTLQAIEDLHFVGFIHRDIKPENFAIGTGSLQRRVYMLDFGLARKYTTEEGIHRMPRRAVGFRGTVEYASVASHERKDQSRRDDIESWLYMIIKLATATLPWSREDDDAKVMQAKIRSKSAAGMAELLHPSLPRTFQDITMHINSLDFYDVPSYDQLQKVLKSALKNGGFSEFPYDWEKGNGFDEDDANETFFDLPGDRSVFGKKHHVR